MESPKRRGPLWPSYPRAPPSLWISYAVASHHRRVRSLSKNEARRVGAELKRWSQRPVSVANGRALGLCVVLIVFLLVAAQHAPQPAAAVRTLAALIAVMLTSLHFMAKGALRGLLQAGVAEAREAMDAMRNPRRISAFDMAMMWMLVAMLARYWE